MFWAMMYLLFFGGSAAPELLIPDETRFHNAIKDQQRLMKVLAIREEAKTTEQILAKMLENRYTDLANLSSQYKADINQFRVIADELDSARLDAQSILLDKRFHLREQMSRKEWKRVYGSR